MPLNRVPVCFWECASSNLPNPTASGSDIDPITGNGIALQDQAKVEVRLQSESEAADVLEQLKCNSNPKVCLKSSEIPFKLVLHTLLSLLMALDARNHRKSYCK